MKRGPLSAGMGLTGGLSKGGSGTAGLVLRMTFLRGLLACRSLGNIDLGRSDELRTRSRGGGPEWVKRHHRGGNVPRITEESGAEVVHGGRWLYLPAMALTSVVGMTIGRCIIDSLVDNFCFCL
jgi:hypothetical protein